jgi:drug/metabolite transporter (DMT)-like permease
MRDGRARILLLTAGAMLAFAANSLLCRLALTAGTIDPASFAALRLLSGALALGILVRCRGTVGAAGPARADWLAAAMLFAYVACFALAYRSLTASAGALILFGAVQLTMFAAGLWRGERFLLRAWAGVAVAIAGLVCLLAPRAAAPPPGGAMLMAAAGLAWGIYSLRGRGVADPLAATAANFLRAAPLGLLLCLPFGLLSGLPSALPSGPASGLLQAGGLHADLHGAALAIVSGALTSGIGYAIWYTALRGLSSMQAATVQLAVPPLAALGGALWLGEAIEARLVLASVAVLGGIALVVGGAQVKTAPPSRVAPLPEKS